MSTVRAKFHIREIVQSPHNQGGKVTLSAVSRGDRNATWATATPSGEITMHVNNPSGFAWFEDIVQRCQRGEITYPEVFVDFTLSTDDLTNAGHEFRPADVPENHYSSGKCGLCGLDKAAAVHSSSAAAA